MNGNDLNGCIFVLQENGFLELQSVGKAAQGTSSCEKYNKDTLSGVNSLAETCTGINNTTKALTLRSR